VFVGGNPHKLVLFWSGEGHNAKSVTQTLFEQMMGKYAIKLPTSLLTGKRTASSNASPELARSGNGVRWAVLQEPDKSDVINIGVLKELSGNDTFFARALHKNGREIKPMFKLIFICNDPPKLPYNDQAAWNRIRVLPFESTFCDDAPETYEEQVKQKRFPKDPYFEDKIPGMLEAFAWYLLEHRKTHPHKHGYSEPEKVKLATSNYQKQNDVFKQFEDDVIVPDDTKGISLTEVYNYFKEWFRESIPNQTVPNKNDVKDHFMKAWGAQVKRKWRGRRVRTIEDEEDDE
jgi:P4 family phage/plasmid primase-like protien